MRMAVAIFNYVPLVRLVAIGQVSYIANQMPKIVFGGWHALFLLVTVTEIGSIVIRGVPSICLQEVVVFNCWNFHFWLDEVNFSIFFISYTPTKVICWPSESLRTVLL